MRASRRNGAAVLVVAIASLVGFTYVRPVTVLETAGETLLRVRGVRSAHVQAGPYRLHYLEAGSGPPLVLVHGLGSNGMQDWGRLVASLSRQFHVYAPDLPGYGRSDRPPDADYSIPFQVDAVRAFMDAVGVDRARVAGISMGGWIVSRLAAESPERVQRLVVVDAAGMRPDGPPIPAEVLLPRNEVDVRQLIGAVRHKAPDLPSFVVRAILARRLQEEWVVRRALESMRDGGDWLNGTLARADMPVLVMWGKQDALISVDYAAALQAEFPRAELEVLDGCGHVLMADCPEAFDRVFLEFLGATP
ncbi:MAG: alpha/beta fold hydrolase [Acidobacteria bacterium]|nr:alpha/beta fold hydrolase [Acidobacteriota bacterium]